MPNLNKVMLIGHLGADPQIRYMPSGDAVCNLSLATSEKWKDKEGQQQEETQWHRLTMFRRNAEVANEYLRKGAAVFIEGRIKYRTYEKDGEKKYSTDIEVFNFQMLGGKSAAAPSQQAPKGAPAQQPLEDDIPF